MECGSYWWLKLLEHVLKSAERVFAYRARQQVKINNMQPGSVGGKGSKEAMFTVADAWEGRYVERQNDL